MASIYFYYNELLRHSADQAVMNDKNSHGSRHEEDLWQQQGDTSFEKKHQHQELNRNPGQEKLNTIESHDEEDNAVKVPFLIHPDTEAMLVALQPRLNRLAYLQTAVVTNLDALIRSLGPKL